MFAAPVGSRRPGLCWRCRAQPRIAGERCWRCGEVSACETAFLIDAFARMSDLWMRDLSIVDWDGNYNAAGRVVASLPACPSSADSAVPSSKSETLPSTAS